VTDGVLTGSVKVGSTSYPFTETALVNTNAGYVAYGFNAGGVNMDDITINMKGEKKIATAEETEGGNITVQRVTSDVPGMYKYVVTATADEGSQLKANTLLGTDANGNTVYPAGRVGFQSDLEGGDAYYFYSAEDVTFSADFYTALEAADANLAVLGTSYNEAKAGVRFVFRAYVNRDAEGKAFIEIDGKDVAVKDYGLLLATEDHLAGRELNLENDEADLYIVKRSLYDTETRYDISANYEDVSIQVTGVYDEEVGFDQRDLRISARMYVVLEDGTTVYTAMMTTSYNEAMQP